MTRRSRKTADDPFADLAKKIEILEQEMAVQRAAIERLKDLGSAATAFHQPAVSPVRKTA